MAKKKDTAVDLAFNHFDAIVNTFFREATGSLEELKTPTEPKIKQQKPRLPKNSNPFRI